VLLLVLIRDLGAHVVRCKMTIVIVEKWTIRPEMMSKIQDFLNDLPKWRKLDEAYGGKSLGLFRTIIGEGPSARFMAVFTMPDWATWGKLLSEAGNRMPEEAKRWNEMVTNSSTEIMEQVNLSNLTG